MQNGAASYLQAMTTVPGWFREPDASLFCLVAGLQRARGVRGDLLEIGTYFGRSAILLGYLAAPGETLTVCDLFEDPAPSAEGTAEQAAHYRTLRRAEFERHYRRFHSALPEIVAAPSATLSPETLGRRFRLIHIDGGHEYPVVKHDILLARRLMAPGGVVIFDDWAMAHVPGVAMAVWEEYLRGELIPLGFSLGKLYATWDRHGLRAADLDAGAEAHGLGVSHPCRLGAHEARHYTEPKALAAASKAPPAPRSRLGRLLARFA